VICPSPKIDRHPAHPLPGPCSTSCLQSGMRRRGSCGRRRRAPRPPCALPSLTRSRRSLSVAVFVSIPVPVPAPPTNPPSLSSPSGSPFSLPPASSFHALSSLVPLHLEEAVDAVVPKIGQNPCRSARIPPPLLCLSHALFVSDSRVWMSTSSSPFFHPSLSPSLPPTALGRPFSVYLSLKESVSPSTNPSCSDPFHQTISL
jgi:hypothetical protein